MSVYLVDYENVNAGGFRGVEMLNENDDVYIFYSNKASSLSFETHQKLVECKARVKYFEVGNGGKNALDFQLTLFTGYLLGKGINENIYLISNDKGFDYNLAFYENYLMAENVDIFRSSSIAATVSTGKKPASQIKQSTSAENMPIYEMLCALLPDYSSCDIINISSVLLGTENKKKFYTELVSRFKQEKGLDIYNKIKSEYTNLKKKAKSA
ncbi:MAG: PIN domain-containing protein [Porcipelethomonas sp.]